MLLIKTEVKSSKISGLGLFSLEDVKYGEIVEVIEDKFYKIFTQEEINELNKSAVQAEYEHDYMFKQGDLYFACLDNARFMNHSNTPNCFYKGTTSTAILQGIHGYFFAHKDIKIGDEITVDYTTFCDKGIDW